MNDIWLKLMKIGSYFGCHQKPERSFYYKKYQFPVCARCMGVIMGYIISIIVSIFVKIPIWLCLVFMLIMFGDWFLQYKNILQSNNIRRLITGIMCGYGLMELIIYVTTYFIGILKVI